MKNDAHSSQLLNRKARSQTSNFLLQDRRSFYGWAVWVLQILHRQTTPAIINETKVCEHWALYCLILWISRGVWLTECLPSQWLESEGQVICFCHFIRPLPTHRHFFRHLDSFLQGKYFHSQSNPQTLNFYATRKNLFLIGKICWLW